MRPNTNPSSNNISGKVVLIVWLISALLAYLTGSIATNSFNYVYSSQKLSAEVINKSSAKVRNSSSTASYSTRLSIIYQFENPGVNGKFELESELAPLVYGLIRKGDIIDIYYNPSMRPKSRLAHPIQVWFSSVLCLVILAFAILTSVIITKHSQSHSKYTKRYFLWLLGVMIVPVIVNTLLIQQRAQQLAKETAAEHNWPSWPEFEQAVPKPSWWAEVEIKYFDPMNYSSEEFREYVDKNKGPDRYLRKFKVTYALMLRHQDNPLQQGWDLANGTTREFMPMYAFFLNHYMTRQWDGNCYSAPCNDATQMVEMAGDLISMKLDENQIDSSLELAENIMRYKYPRANNRGKYYFLYSYRRLLEHLHNKQFALEQLQDLVAENTTEAEGLNNPSLLRKWQSFWSSSQREVGMFDNKSL